MEAIVRCECGIEMDADFDSFLDKSDYVDKTCSCGQEYCENCKDEVKTCKTQTCENTFCSVCNVNADYCEDCHFDQIDELESEESNEK